MSIRHRHRPLALSAVLTASLTSAMGLAASDANAVNAGSADSALTVSDGSSTLVVGGTPVTFPTTVTDAAWAPNGSRVTFVDGNGDLVTSKADGTDLRVVAHNGSGWAIAHPTWMSDGGGIVFASAKGTGIDSIKFAQANGYGNTLTGGGDGTALGEIPATLDNGTDTSPDGFFTASGIRDWTAGEHIVYQHVPQGQTAPEIWMVDQRQQMTSFKIADGSEPTVSPDGNLVAFVDATGQIAVIDLTQPTGSNGLRTPKVITTDSLHKRHPTFSPDGSKIAYEAFTPGATMSADTAKDVESVPAAGGTPTVEWSKPGVPAYRPTAKSHVTRLSGNDRTGTAIAASQAVWATATANNDQRDRATAVVLSRSDQFADALGGSALAAHKGPLLLTHTDALDPAVRDEIVRVLGPANVNSSQTVYILGGDQALSPAVEKAVTDLGYSVVRLKGANRYETSVAIAKAVTDHPYQVLLATGNGYADALSAGAAAGARTWPSVVVLTNDKTMPSATASYLQTVLAPPAGTSAPMVYEIGGQAKAAADALWPAGSASRPWTIALVGADRYQTSFLVAREFFGFQTTHVGVATALNWPDSLSGGAVMGHEYGPLLLVNPQTGLTPAEAEWVTAGSGGIDRALIFGGPAGVAAGTDDQLGAAISGPAGYDLAANPQLLP